MARWSHIAWDILSSRRDTFNDPLNEQAALQNVTRFNIPGFCWFSNRSSPCSSRLSRCGQLCSNGFDFKNSTFSEYFIEVDV